MIDDGFRGYLLELMTTKLLCLGQPVQIIAMSATLTVRLCLLAPLKTAPDTNPNQNIHVLKTWLQGHSYETHYRPVPIEEHLV